MGNTVISFRAPRGVKAALRRLARRRFGDPDKIGAVLMPRILNDLRDNGLLKDTDNGHTTQGGKP